MVVQIPLIFVTLPLENMQGINGKIIGNCIFWVSFCLVGQPLAALMYFFAWVSGLSELFLPFTFLFGSGKTSSRVRGGILHLKYVLPPKIVSVLLTQNFRSKRNMAV